jgi:hypothetical protein
LRQIILPPTLSTRWHHRRREVLGYQPAYVAIFALLALIGGTRDVETFLIRELSDGHILFTDQVITSQCARKCGWDYTQRHMFDRLWPGFLIPFFDTGIMGTIEVSPHLDLPEHALLPWLKDEDSDGGYVVNRDAFGSATKEKIDPNSHDFKRLLDPVGLPLLATGLAA